MATTSSSCEPPLASADREIVISRVVGAPPEIVFEAFTQVRHLAQWWGPDGFSTTTRSFEFRAGGMWDFRDAWAGRNRLPGVDHLAGDRPG